MNTDTMNPQDTDSQTDTPAGTPAGAPKSGPRYELPFGSNKRWFNTGCATTFTSSKPTLGRPATSAFPRAASAIAIAARGDAP